MSNALLGGENDLFSGETLAIDGGPSFGGRQEMHGDCFKLP